MRGRRERGRGAAYADRQDGTPTDAGTEGSKQRGGRGGGRVRLEMLEALDVVVRRFACTGACGAHTRHTLRWVCMTPSQARAHTHTHTSTRARMHAKRAYARTLARIHATSLCAPVSRAGVCV